VGHNYVTVYVHSKNPIYRMSRHSRLNQTPEEREASSAACLERWAGEVLPLRSLGVALLAELPDADLVTDCIRDLWWRDNLVVVASGTRGMFAAFPRRAELIFGFDGRWSISPAARPRVRGQAIRAAGVRATSVQQVVGRAFLTECRWLKDVDQRVWAGLLANPGGQELAGQVEVQARRVLAAESEDGYVRRLQHIRADGPSPETAARIRDALEGYQAAVEGMGRERGRLLAQLGPLLLNERVMGL
jgi:hypothetical protein